MDFYIKSVTSYYDTKQLIADDKRKRLDTQYNESFVKSAAEVIPSNQVKWTQ